MADAFAVELSSFLARRGDDVAAIRGIKSSSDRVDALTMLVREAVRASSLCYVDGVFHVFGGRCYEPLPKQAILADLSNVLTDAGLSPTDIRKMADMPLSVVSERSYARSPYLLCFGNCVLGISTDDNPTYGLIPMKMDFSPKHLVTERMDYDYDPSAKCPLWDAFLEEVLPDASVRKVLQEFFGMCYLDRRRLSVEKFLILIGAGANGKSVIFEVMKRVLGEDNVSTFDSRQLTDEKMIPYVSGRRLNFAPDMKAASDFDSAMKALASGQDVAGRRIYGDAEKVKCPPLCFALNEIPRFRDTTPAFFRRVIPIRFDVVIPPEKQDKGLVGRIVTRDLPGIFNWVIDGRNRLMRQGGEFTPSARIDAYSVQLRGFVDARENPVKTWLATRGYSVWPLYEGQPSVRISQREIASGIGGISPTAITREMGRYGATAYRSREIYYRVYPL